MMTASCLPPRSFSRCRWAGLVGLALGLALSVSAQTDTLVVSLGAPMERLTAASDPTQHYALYLPSSYTPEAPPPVMFLMDPRGQAMTPLRLFQAEAEKRGYILISSHETLSDDLAAFGINERALTAMIQDVQLRFTVDTDRFYLVGFSGTAHFAWAVAPSLDGHLAGIVGVGDGLSPYLPGMAPVFEMGRLPAYVGIAGTHDFNYDNTVLRHLALEDLGLRRRFRSFPGRHSWPPESLASEALAWFDWLAARDMLSPDTLQAQYAARLLQAVSVEAEGDARRALRLYREAEADFSELVDVSEARNQARRLARSRAVRRILRDEERLAQEVQAYKALVGEVLQAMAREDSPMPPARAARRLDLDDLLRETDKTERPLRAAAARRKLETAYVNLAFYGPIEAMEAGLYGLANDLLTLARSIKADEPGACYRHTQVLSQLGRLDEAMETAHCALALPWLRRQLHEDPLIAPLRQDPQFEEQFGAES
ncbi:MAG: hypothetical protein AAF170_05590 [Bacteroidota bacterium]